MRYGIVVVLLFLTHFIGAQQPRLVAPVGHKGTVTNVEFNSKSNIVLTNDDYSIILWDFASAKPLIQLQATHGLIGWAHIMQNSGNIITSAAYDSFIFWWNKNGELIKTIPFPSVNRGMHALGNQGRLIAILGLDRVIVMNGDSGIDVASFPIENPTNISNIEFSSDDDKILLVYRNGNLVIYDAKRGITLNRIGNIGVSSYSTQACFGENDSCIYRVTQKVEKFNLGAISNAELVKENSEIGGEELITDIPHSKLILFSPYLIEVRNLKTGRFLFSIKRNNDTYFRSPVYNCEDGILFTGDSDSSFLILDILTADTLSQIQFKKDNWNLMGFSTEPNRIIFSEYGSVHVWNWITKEIEKSWTGTSFQSGFFTATLNGNKTKIYINSHDYYTGEIWDLKSTTLFEDTITEANFNEMDEVKNKRIKYELSNGILKATYIDSSIKSLFFKRKGLAIEAWVASRDEQFVGVLYDDFSFCVYRIRGSHKNEIIRVHHTTDFKFTFDSRNLIINHNMYDLGSRKILYRLWQYPEDAVEFAVRPDLSPDGKYLVYSDDNRAIIVDARTGVVKNYLIGHSASVFSTRFNEDGSRIVTTSMDGFLKVWDAENGKLLFSFTTIFGKEQIWLLPNGYYKCTPGIGKTLGYISKDLKIMAFEQFDIKYNRPDLVLAHLGGFDTVLIKSYYQAWIKRIKKLGIDTTQFSAGYSVPEMDFVNRDAIEYEQKNNQLNIHIKGNDTTYKLDRFNIWINEIPLYGQKGISIRNRNANSMDTTINIELSAGENRIETSILNANGTESYRMPLYVKYIPQTAEKKKIHFIGLAVEQFTKPEYNLQYSVKDIRQLAKKMRDRYGDTLEIDTLFNEKVTQKSVAAIKSKLLKTNVNDNVILAYSGHGLLSKTYDYYLGTSVVDFDHPENGGLPYEALENLLDSIPARQKLMLIDACHSGEVDKDEKLQMEAQAKGLGLKSKGVTVENTDSSAATLGLQNSFELMQELFVNVGKGTGATIISASAGTQFALENGELENGVFTYSILEAMNNNSSLTVSQLKTIVGKRVVELTNGMQKPTSRNETINSDWRVW